MLAMLAAAFPTRCLGQSTQIAYPRSTAACTEEDAQFLYTECTNSTTPPSILGVPFFDPAVCDESRGDSAALPAFVHAPCDFACEPGYAIGPQGVCEACPIGTYSAGDALDVFAGAPSSFAELEAKGMWTGCKYKSPSSSSFDRSCGGWTLGADGALTTGPYDEANTYYSWDCLVNPDLHCVNNLRSELRLDVTLVKDGSVAFDYSVDAERTYDGLRFYVDEASAPLLNLTSVTESTRTLEVPLRKGRHTLTWLYSKDNAFTKGKDTAELTRIVVYGSDKRSRTCVSCPRGTSTSAPGSAECAACAPDQIWSRSGSAAGSATGTIGRCASCPAGSHPDEERTACEVSPACGAADMDERYSACTRGGFRFAWERTKSYVWKPSRPCVRAASLPASVREACPACPPQHWCEVRFSG